MARSPWIRGASGIDPKKIYNIKYQPLSGAPTYVYGIFGRTTANQNYVYGKDVLKLGEKLANEKYSQHYIIDYSEERSVGRFAEQSRQLADENSKKVGQLHDRAMKELNSFYRNSLTRDYGSEWDYQPKGGTTSNSTH